MPGFAPPAESRLSPMMIVVAPHVVGTRGTKLSLLCWIVLGGVFTCWIPRCCVASSCCRSSPPTRSEQTSSGPVPSGTTSESWPMEEDGESEAEDDLKMEEQTVGNRNDSTGTDLPKKPGSDLFCDANGPSKSLKPEVDLKAESMDFPYLLTVPSATKILEKIKSTFAKSWISFLRLLLPFDVYKEESSKETATRGLLRSHHLRRLFLLLLVASVLSATIPMAVSDVGTASFYGPPYDRTDCFGEGSFPESNLFAAVGDELWDMGDACGREYEVRCTSGCKPSSGVIRVKTVDSAFSVGPRQSMIGADLVLSQFAFEAIANPSMNSISVEFNRV